MTGPVISVGRIFGDPGAVSRVDKMFVAKVYCLDLTVNFHHKHFIDPTNCSWVSEDWLVGPKCPFPFEKIVVPSTALLYSATKRAVAWVGSLQPVGTVPLGTWNFRNFKPEFLLNGKRPTSFTYKKDQRGLDGKANDLMLALKT